MLTSPCGNLDLILRSSSIGSDFRSGIAAKNRSSSIVTNIYEPHEDQPNEDHYYRTKSLNRYGRLSKNSPTPSIKRGKAEKLLKEHGSPPGVRVTAGGRIVPDGLSPLNSPGPYFKYPAHMRSDRIVPYPMPMNIAPKIFPGQLFDAGNGILYQLVDGELRPVALSSGLYSLPVAPVNMNMLPAMSNYAQYGGLPMYANVNPVLPTAMTPANQSSPACKPSAEVSDFPDARTLRIMEENNTKLQAELKELDRSEVLQRDLLTPAMRNEIVKQRISLVNRLDESRRGITEVKKLMNLTDDGANENTATRNNTQSHYPRTMGQSSYPGPLPPNFGPLETTSFVMPSYPAPGAEFQHEQQVFAAVNVDEYVQPQKEQQVSSDPSPLQERSGNIDLGHSFRDAITQSSRHCPHETSASKQNGIYSGVRRSHAVEIKKPSEVNKAKSSLNPASPSYEPAYVSATAGNLDVIRIETPNAFMPSPRLIAEMDHLVRSPSQEERTLTESAGELAAQPSVSSISTGDFFPTDTHNHSTTKYNFAHRDVKVHLPTWISTNGSHGSQDLHEPISRSSNKFLWSDGSEESQVSGLSSQAIHRPNPEPVVPTTVALNTPGKAAAECDMDFISQASFRQISPATQRRQSSQLQDANTAGTVKPPVNSRSIRTSAANILENASFKAFSIQNASPTKTAGYWEGFQMGMQQSVLTEIKDKDYCRGYRDGLIQSSMSVMQAQSSAASATFQQASPSAFSNYAVGSSTAFKNPSMPRTASMPSIAIPAVPANSLVNSPLQINSADHSPFVVQSPGSATSPWGPSHRQIGTQTSKLHIFPDPISPLANRNSGNANMSQSNSANASNVPREVRTGKATCNDLQGPLPKNDLYNQQRFSKAPTSIAPSNNHARGWFPQLDGSGDDDASDEKKVSDITPTSPTMRAAPRTSQPPSPVKRTASAAMTKVQQIAGISGRKDKSSVDTQADPAKMSSPEKAQWRAKWRKRFENLKEDEKKEIAKYKDDHPIA